MNRKIGISSWQYQPPVYETFVGEQSDTYGRMFRYSRMQSVSLPHRWYLANVLDAMESILIYALNSPLNPFVDRRYGPIREAGAGRCQVAIALH